METYTCTCGARYRVPAGAAGKRARCKRCNAEFILSGAEPLEVAKPPPTPVSSGLDAIAAIDRGGWQTASSAVTVTGFRGFWSDVAWSLLFFLEPGNLVTFVMVWLVVGFQNVGLGGPGAFGITLFIVWTLGIFLSLWLMAFLMNVIREAASGEPDLPRCTEFEDALDDMVRPLLQFIGTGFVVLLPALGLSWVEAIWGVGIPPWAITLAAGIGLFFWPMSVLCVSIAGLGIFLQVNLLIESVFRTFWTYVGVCLVFGTALALSGAAWLLSIGLVFLPIATPTPVALATLASGLQAWSLIVAMRVIGLYYHHYKERFAWSWG
jgi:hypothetical protein